MPELRRRNSARDFGNRSVKYAEGKTPVPENGAPENPVVREQMRAAKVGDVE